MNAKELYGNFLKKKAFFREYIKETKLVNKTDIFSVINPTLISNPYITQFPKEFFSELYNSKEKTSIFRAILKFYLKMIVKLFIYCFSFVLFKIFYKKKRMINDTYIIFDIYFLVKNIVSSNKFSDNYFKSVYPVLDELNIKYAFMVRLYGIGLNLKDFIRTIQITNKSQHNFIYEFEYLKLLDFLKLVKLITLYPWKTQRLYKKEDSLEDKIFNKNLVKDIGNVQFEAFSRYLFAKSLSKKYQNLTIYSWSEFQDIERAFILGIREEKSAINLIGCQFYLNFETYFSTYLNDEDHKLDIYYNKILVNGKYYLREVKNVEYQLGPSLRYSNIFDFISTDLVKKEKILILGSYILEDTENMLKSLPQNGQYIFKNHPAVDIKKLKHLLYDIEIVNEDIYKLFELSDMVIGVSSGSLVEAVACGKSVIIIASDSNLTANPLVNYGKGKIWDIAFSKDDVKIIYNKLKIIRENNSKEINTISKWYKDNFFVQPNKMNILKMFEKGEM